MKQCLKLYFEALSTRPERISEYGFVIRMLSSKESEKFFLKRITKIFEKNGGKIIGTSSVDRVNKEKFNKTFVFRVNAAPSKIDKIIEELKDYHNASLTYLIDEFKGNNKAF